MRICQVRSMSLAWRVILAAENKFKNLSLCVVFKALEKYMISWLGLERERKAEHKKVDGQGSHTCNVHIPSF